MACLIVPVAEAIVVTIVTKAVAAREKNGTTPDTLRSRRGDAGLGDAGSGDAKIPFSRKLKWLSNLLWGGSALLAFEHVWHGELVPRFPFLTAVGNPGDTAAMLREMATAGVAMALLVTAVWAGMLLVAAAAEKKALKARAAEK